MAKPTIKSKASKSTIRIQNSDKPRHTISSGAILQQEDRRLRQISSPVEIKEITSLTTRRLITQMHKALATCKDGVALAAPQTGVNLRIFVISPLLWSDEAKQQGNLVYINPEITKKSSNKVQLDEGCLSVKGVYGRVKRHEKVTVVAYDKSGHKFTRGASGLLAEIFQHEIDHLDGKLFIDTATDLHKVDSV